MTRQRSRNSFLSFLDTVIVVLILAVAFGARAQVKGVASNPPQFQPPVIYDSGGFEADGVAVGDVNGDGKLDLVVTNHCLSYDDCPYSDTPDAMGQGTVGVLLGRGNGTFQRVVTHEAGYNLGRAPRSLPVAVADLNQDGNLDLVVASSGYLDSDGELQLLFGNGDGTFLSGWFAGSQGWLAVSVAVGDVNGDSLPDLLVANTCAYRPICDDFNCECETGSVGVLLNTGFWSFSSAGIVDSNLRWARSISVGDVNRDGKLDLLVTTASGGVGVVLGNGDGTFKPAILYGSGGRVARSTALGDVNGDGKPDLLVANLVGRDPSDPSYSSGGVGVLLGNGDGTFKPAMTYDSGGSLPWSVATGDVNGDGKADLVLGNGNGTAGVLLGKGDGTFQSALVFSTGGSVPASVVLADLNADGKLDLVFGNEYGAANGDGEVSVLMGKKAASTTTLASSLNPSIYGQNITWTATVTTFGSVPATGKVSFRWSRDGRTYEIGGAPLNASGVATLTRSTLNVPFGAPYPLVAVYLGDTMNLRSTSGVLVQDVLQTKSVAAITSSLNPSSHGQPVTFTARITSPTVTPTGPVTFTAGNTVLGTAQLSGKTARFTTSALPVGSTSVKVTYFGNSNIAKSSASLTQIVH